MSEMEEAQNKRAVREAFGTTAGVLLGVGIAVVALGLFTVPFLLWKGWVLAVLWRWFAVPLGLPALSVPRAIGFALLLRLLVPGEFLSDLMDEEQRARYWKSEIGRSLAGPALALALGWAVKHYC